MRSVCITFDDGYRDSLDLAAPMLEEYSLPATFFLVPAFVSGESHAWWERLSWCVLGASASVLHWRDRVIPLRERASRVDVVEQLAAGLKMLSRREREDAVEEMVEQLVPVGPPYREDLFLDWDLSRSLGPGFMVVADRDGAVAAGAGVRSWPTTVAVDRQGGRALTWR